MKYDICIKTTSQAALIAALAPLGLTAIDEDGTEHLKIGSADHAMAYVGRVVATPAVIDPETMTVTAPATFLPGEYAIMRATPNLLARVAAVVEVVEPPAGCPTFGEWCLFRLWTFRRSRTPPAAGSTPSGTPSSTALSPTVTAIATM